MSIHRFQSTWRGQVFNPHLDDSGITDNPANLIKANIASRYVLEAVNVNRVSAQDYRELRQYLEGAEPNEAYEGVRAITAQGFMQGSTAADLEDKAWALNELFSIAACRAAAVATTPKGVLPYDFKRASVAGTKALRFYARPGPARPVWIGHTREGLIRPFSWQLVAFDPFAYDQVNSFIQATPLASSVITNPGNIYTKPTIRISFSGAGAANFTITNATTGQVFVIDATTAFGGDLWYVDVATSTMFQNGTLANRFSQRVSGSISSMILVPGANTIQITNVGGIATVHFDFRGAYA